MSVRIKISYTDDLELAGIIHRLAPNIKRCKYAEKQKGKYKRAYIDYQEDPDIKQAAPPQAVKARAALLFDDSIH